MYKYYFANKSVAPKKAALAAVREAQAKTEAVLNEANSKMNMVKFTVLTNFLSTHPRVL
jgi:hypothetical protein